MLFNSKMKLADVVVANYNLVLILQRFNIELGFGEKTVAEICKQYGIDTNFFLLICNVYTTANYLPTKEELANTQMDMLVPYLVASHVYYLQERIPHLEIGRAHVYYLQERIPHLENHLNRIADACKPTQGETLRKFFHEYKGEVEKHFQYEENTVFPYITDLCKGGKGQRYSINQFEENHSNIEDKLGDLTNIILKYLPGDIMPNERRGLVFDIFQLS